MFTVIYILEEFAVGAETVGGHLRGVSTSDDLKPSPYRLRVSSSIWQTREAAQDYADYVAKDRKAFVVQLPETYTTN